MVSAGGLGLGVLVSAAFVEFLPAPRVLPYVALFVLFAIAFAGVWLMPEPVASRSRLQLTPQWPSVPREVRRPFFLAALGVMSSWSIGGLFLSLGPQLSGDLFHTDQPPRGRGPASSRWPARRRWRSSRSAARRRGRARPPGRWRSPRAWC